jgi:polynucleotide 5'-hydroxyl-kinase GRC3/NOL9
MFTGVLMILITVQALMLAGMYTLTPLQRPLSILSTVLAPLASHTIFAPTSHPLPIISPTSEMNASSHPILAELHLPPSFMLSESGGSLRTVFLLGELRSGMDGLRGGAVPGFTNIWLEDKEIWGLRDVHPVSLRYRVS